MVVLLFIIKVVLNLHKKEQKPHTVNSYHSIYMTRLVTRNKIKLSNSEHNNVEPSEKSKTLEPSRMFTT